MLRPINAPAHPPITRPPIPPPASNSAPTAPPAHPFSFRMASFRVFENGDRDVPCQARTLRIETAPFSRLHGIHAGRRLLPWLLPPVTRGRECSTSHAPLSPRRP